MNSPSPLRPESYPFRPPFPGSWGLKGKLRSILGGGAGILTASSPGFGASGSGSRMLGSEAARFGAWLGGWGNSGSEA